MSLPQALAWPLQTWVLLQADCSRPSREQEVGTSSAALPSEPTEDMSDYENDDECWSALESFRVKLISVIDPSRITPYLRQCKVLNPDDEEQVLSDPNLVIRKRKVGEGCSHTSRAGSSPS